MLILRAPPPPRGYHPGRIANLATPRKNHGHEIDWPVGWSQSEKIKWIHHPKSTSCTKRVCDLAKAKSYDGMAKNERQVETIVSLAARRAKCSQRVGHLATPKKSFLKSWNFIESRRAEEPITQISEGAKNCVPSQRIETLSVAKGFHTKFQHANLSFWNVRRQALNTTCPDRTAQLAKFIERPSINDVNYNPHCFVVTTGAKKAVCSSRLQELSKPKANRFSADFA